MVIRTSLRPLGKNEDDGIPTIEFGTFTIASGGDYIVKGITTSNYNKLKHKICLTMMMNYGTTFQSNSVPYIGNWLGGACSTDNDYSNNYLNGSIGNMLFEHHGDNKFVAWPQIVSELNTCAVKPETSSGNKYLNTSNVILDPYEGNAYMHTINNNNTYSEKINFKYLDLNSTLPATTKNKLITTALNLSMVVPLMFIYENGTTTSGNFSSSGLCLLVTQTSSGTSTLKKWQKLNTSTSLTINAVNTSINYSSWKLPKAFYYCNFARGYENKIGVCGPLYQDGEHNFTDLSCLAADTSSLDSNNKPTNVGGFKCNSYDYDSSSTKRYIRIVGPARDNISTKLIYDSGWPTWASTVLGSYKIRDGQYKLLYLSGRPTSSGAIWKAIKFTSLTYRLTFKKQIWAAKLFKDKIIVQFMDSSIAFIDGSDYSVRYFRPTYSLADKMTDNDDIRKTSKKFLILTGLSNGYVDFMLCTGNPTVASGWFPRAALQYDDATSSYYIMRTSATWDYIKANCVKNPELITIG